MFATDPARAAGQIRRVLRPGGRLALAVGAASFDEWWTRTTALAGPLAKRLALLPDEAARDLTARVREAVRPFETPAGLEFPGVSLLATATKRRHS